MEGLLFANRGQPRSPHRFDRWMLQKIKRYTGTMVHEYVRDRNITQSCRRDVRAFRLVGNQ